MKQRICVKMFFCLFITSSLLFSADSQDKEKDIRSLLDLMGSPQLVIQAMTELIDVYKEAVPEVPEEFWEEFMEEVRPEDLTDLVVPVYDKYLTHSEIKELIEFFESPVGRKYAEVLPQITQEVMAAGEKWGLQLGQKAIRKLQEAGYKE